MHRIAPVVFTLLLFVVPASAQRYVLYVFDQTADAVIRLIDLDGDGFYDGPGEATVFYDSTPGPLLGLNNSQGMVALGVDRLLATDNFAPENIIYLEDLDGNGDAFGPGEAREVFNGNLPDGFSMTNPADLLPRNPMVGEGFLLLDNNTLNDANPEAVYTLIDLNGDGDFNDPGEVVRNIILSPVGECCSSTFLGITQDNSGYVYGIDIAQPASNPSQIRSIDRIDPVNGTRNEWINNNTTFTNLGRFLNGGLKIDHNPITDEIIVEMVDGGFNKYLYALRDVNGSGTIDGFDEVRLLWSELGNADGVTGGSIRDMIVMPDGSIFALDNLRKRIRHYVDLNGDGTFQGPGETRIVYDAAIAGMNGAFAIGQLLSIAAIQIPECIGDIADDFGFTAADGGGPDGQVDFGDFVALLGLIGPCDGGTPGCLGDIADDFGFTVNEGGGPDGVVDFGDFVALLGLIGPCD